MSNMEMVKQEAAAKKIVTVYDFMDAKRDLLAKALPKHITVDRMVGMFTLVIKNNPDLLKCSQMSLISAMVQTAQLGLMPGSINHCYYVPFKNKKKDGSVVSEVQFILAYRGMIELVNRSGQAAILSAECVYEHDSFSWSLGLNPSLVHVPAQSERGKFIAVYCTAKNKIVDEKIFLVMTSDEIAKVRNASKAGQSDYSPWAKWFEEMAKKTVIKRICKILPLAVDIQKKLAADETIKSEIAPDMTAVPDETNWEEGEIIEAPATSSEKDWPKDPSTGDVQ